MAIKVMELNVQNQFNPNDVSSTIPLHQQAHTDEPNGLITHPLIDALGHTTNVLIMSYFIVNRGEEKTRNDVREAIEQHKSALAQTPIAKHYLSRVRDGKATVNYWIDRLVEQKVLGKQHSNPVVFWLDEKHELVRSMNPSTLPKGLSIIRWN